jgi:hypothetical protein
VATETPSKIPALQITHTVDDVWHVAAKWSDGPVENITAFESELESNEWIANDFQEWLERLNARAMDDSSRCLDGYTGRPSKKRCLTLVLGTVAI